MALVNGTSRSDGLQCFQTCVRVRDEDSTSGVVPETARCVRFGLGLARENRPRMATMAPLNAILHTDGLQLVSCMISGVDQHLRVIGSCLSSENCGCHPNPSRLCLSWSPLLPPFPRVGELQRVYLCRLEPQNESISGFAWRNGIRFQPFLGEHWKRIQPCVAQGLL